MGKASRRKAEKRAAGQQKTKVKFDHPPFVRRPFEGLPNETEWAAMRELISAGTAKISLDVEGHSHDITLATVLPMGWAALKRDTGEVFVAMQAGTSSGDSSRDLAEIALAALSLEPGSALETTPAASAQSPRLQDLLADDSLEVELHDGFDFWVEGQELDDAGKASMERANEAVLPTVRMESAESAYWTRIGDRSYVRWVLGADEDKATDALARLHAAGESGLGDGRLLGAFRAYGLLVPVWEVPVDTEAADHEKALAELKTRLDSALAQDAPLTVEERRARNGVVSRQITLR